MTKITLSYLKNGKGKGTECTWQKIINALESVGENTLANNLKESYKNTSEVFLQ